MTSFDRVDAAARLRQFIQHTILRDPAARMADDEPLMTSGIIDSFAFVDLVQFLEDTFRVRVPESDLTPDRMNTIAMIVARVEQLAAAR